MVPFPRVRLPTAEVVDCFEQSFTSSTVQSYRESGSHTLHEFNHCEFIHSIFQLPENEPRKNSGKLKSCLREMPNWIFIASFVTWWFVWGHIWWGHLRLFFYRLDSLDVPNPARAGSPWSHENSLPQSPNWQIPQVKRRQNRVRWDIVPIWRVPIII